jgi:eukaryotic-like serine/threonine-protein kinase
MKPRPILAVLLVTALLAAILAGCGGRSEVPNVIGMPLDQAVKTLQDAGYELGDVRHGYSSAVAPNTVARQDPAAGTKLAKRSKVSVTIVQPLGSLSTPDVLGKTAAEAQSALATMSLVPAISEDYSAVVAPGVVITQAPAAGTPINPGDTVAMVVSKGPAPERVKVPAINGKDRSSAEKVLRDVGLVPAPSEAYSDTVAKGIVADQNPTAGAYMSPGSKVAFMVSLGKGTQSVSVPNVVGKAQAGAESAIKGAGLVPKAGYNVDPNVPKGVVIGQSPAAGGKTAPGSTVGILVSLGADTSVSVPDVTGKSSQEAADAISAAGFVPQSGTQPSDTVPKGTVISQSPPGGTKASAGSTVLFIVSSGVPPEPK